MSFRDRYGVDLISHFHAWHERTLEIHAEPRPLLGPATRIATIGSCFAEELAAALERLGLRGGMNPTGLVYNTGSLRQEIASAFGEEGAWEDDPAWRVREGFVSPFQHPQESRSSPEKLIAWTRELRRQARELFRSADVIIITIGLVEAWVHPRTGMFYRYLPHQDLFGSEGAELRRLTVEEMKRDLEAIRTTIRRSSRAEIILTVSPVPLHATFTPLDVRVANAESKARIRAAVSEFVDEHPDVHYFHSYEIVTTAERSSDFMLEDGRHVSRPAVDFIIHEFMRTFAGEDLDIPPIDTSWITGPEKTAERPASSAFESLRNQVGLWMRRR